MVNINNYEPGRKIIYIVLLTRDDELSGDEIGESVSAFLMKNLTRIKDNEGCVIPMKKMSVKVIPEDSM